MEKPHFSKMLAFMPTKIRKIQILFFGITQQIHPQKHAVIPHFPFPLVGGIQIFKAQEQMLAYFEAYVCGCFGLVCPFLSVRTYLHLVLQSLWLEYYYNQIVATATIRRRTDGRHYVPSFMVAFKYAQYWLDMRRSA